MGPSGVFFLFASTPVLMLLAILLDTIGRLLCLAMPADQSGTRPIIYVSLAFSLLPLATSALKIGNLFFVLVGSVLFVIFLKNLAKYVQKPDLAGRANTVLKVGVVTVVAILGMVVLAVAAQRPEFVEFLGILGLGVFVLLLGALVLGIILLIMYGKLLTYLRKAVLQHVATESTAG